MHAKGFMTRDFNKPKRDNSRPSFRDQSPNRNRDERSPRPARPRLNREMVDRAWESGAQQQHADYRPRTGGGQSRPQGPQQRTGWRNTPNNQQSGYSSQNGRGNSRPYNNRQEGYRDTRSGGYRDTRDQRETRGTPGNPNRSFNGENSSRPSFGQERRNDNGYRPRPSFGQDRNDRGNQRPDRSTSFNSSNRRDGDDRQRFQDRGNQSRDFRRNDRSNTYGERPQRETSNPKWQSRPSEQRNNTRGPEREFNRRSNTGGEQFEGDYEHFEERDSHTPRDTRPARPAERPFRGSHNSQDHSQKSFGDSRGSQERPARRFDDRRSDVQPERHVTRLPDGRVLKGPRPVQRRNAQFWTGVSKDVGELVGQVDDKKPDDQIQATPIDEVSAIPVVQEERVTTDEPHEEVASQEETPSTDVTPETPQKRRSRIASVVTRGKKSTQSKPSTMKPSQRGFKWPTQE